jgi:hypothetical protein
MVSWVDRYGAWALRLGDLVTPRFLPLVSIVALWSSR